MKILWGRGLIVLGQAGHNVAIAIRKRNVNFALQLPIIHSVTSDWLLLEIALIDFLLAVDRGTIGWKFSTKDLVCFHSTLQWRQWYLK